MERPPEVPAVLVLRDPLGAEAVLRACLTEGVARTGATDVRCDIRLLGTPGVHAASVLARLHLAARTSGCTFGVVGAAPRFVRLLALVGLGDVVACRPPRDPFAPEPGSIS